MRTLPIAPVAAATLVLSACAGSDGAGVTGSSGGPAAGGDIGNGRLSARPGATGVTGERPGAGLHKLAVDAGRPALLYVPPSAAGAKEVPLIVFLHGAGGSARKGKRLLGEVAADLGAVVLSPASRDSTWDLLRGGYGADAAMIDELLRRVLRMLPVDPDRIVLAGSSDGGSYALSLGLTNGDLFRALVAFSPGFSAASQRRGQPVVYVSHGTEDSVLPIDRTSRPLVADLRDDGYRVIFREFDGGHVVPPQIARDAIRRVLPDE